MKPVTSRMGLILSAAYLIIGTLLLYTQGVFGESFIAIILGFPWSFIFAFFEYGNAEGVLLFILLCIPIALNAALLYWLGSLVDKK